MSVCLLCLSVCMYVCVYMYIFAQFFVWYYNNVFQFKFTGPRHIRFTTTTEAQSTAIHAITCITNRSVMSIGAGLLLEARCHYRLFADSGVINAAAVRLPSCPSLCTCVEGGRQAGRQAGRHCSFYAVPIVRCTSPRWRC